MGDSITFNTGQTFIWTFTIGAFYNSQIDARFQHMLLKHSEESWAALPAEWIGDGCDYIKKIGMHF